MSAVPQTLSGYEDPFLSDAAAIVRPIPMKVNSQRRLVVVCHADDPMIQAATQQRPESSIASSSSSTSRRRRLAQLDQRKRQEEEKRESPPPMQQQQEQQRQRKRTRVFSFLDRFTNLCVCGDAKQSMDDDDSSFVAAPTTGAGLRKPRVVYQVQNYPYPLNSKHLVEIRRQSVKHQFFRPVSEDESSVVARYQRRTQ